MSVKVMALAWKTTLSSSEKLVLLYYADRASDDGRGIWPSVATVAKATSLCERSVRNLTRKLLGSGYLVQNGWSQFHTRIMSIDLRKLLRDHHIDQKGQPENSNDNLLRCSENTSGVQSFPETGAAAAPKPSLTINKPSGNEFTNLSKLRRGETYIPRVNEEMQRKLRELNQRKVKTE